MRSIITFLSILFTIPLFAQNHFIGVKGGVSRTNVLADDFIPDRSDKLGFTSGLTYQYQLKKGFHIGADLVYAQKGFATNITLVDINGVILEECAEIQFDYDYLSLPLKAGFSIGNRLGGFVSIGVVPSI